MKKSHEKIKSTSCNREYKTCLKEEKGMCSFCPPSKGCNSKQQIKRNWKKFRKTQWKSE